MEAIKSLIKISCSIIRLWQIKQLKIIYSGKGEVEQQEEGEREDFFLS